MKNLREPEPFLLSSATEAEIDCWFDLKRQGRREVLPDDPDITLPYLLSRANGLNDIQIYSDWAIWDSEKKTMVGLGRVHASKLGFRKGSANIDILVRKNFRKRGLGRSLLKPIVAEAKKHRWEILRGYSNDKCPAGAAFLSGIGAERMYESHINQLILSETNWDIIRKWKSCPDESSMVITIGDFRGSFPEGWIKKISEFYQVVFDAEENDGEERLQFSPEIVRRAEKSSLSGDRKRLTVFASASDSDKLLGLTQVGWSPSQPSILFQGYTAVIPEARRKGIGRRLKAEMLLRVSESLEDAEFIRAGNSAANAPIQQINRELGFTHFVSNYTWSVQTQTLSEFLESGLATGTS